MINFHIENFKCYYNTDIPINYLTVLAGANGNGKSTAIQALLMMRNTYDMRMEEYADANIELNGPYCLSLGTTLDVIPVEAERNSKMVLSLSENNKFLASYTYPLSDEHAELSLRLSEQRCLGDKEEMLLFKNAFYYLNAERIGPRISQGIKMHKYANVGWQGEYCAQILAENSSVRVFAVDKERAYDTEKSLDLLTQTQLWMQKLFPGIIINSEINSKSLTAQISITHNYTSSGASVLSTNVGFGVSYVLPLIITGLIAEKGTMMIVENPEAHLHPSAQTSIAEFLAKIAQTGVYVVVETHSDHFINGIQIAVAEKQLAPQRVVIDYVNQIKETHRPEIKPITLSEKAELSEWPDGFFNQTQKNYARLFNLRMNG
ncbi:MAG: DUF3696 domain-containing protein [Bacteroidales bacterium]|nr:DUF3696 domain-containing protein [Bacteroidales bacterium]